MCAEGSPSCWLTNISNQNHGDPSPHQLTLLLIGLCQCPAQAQHSSAELFSHVLGFLTGSAHSPGVRFSKTCGIKLLWAPQADPGGGISVNSAFLVSDSCCLICQISLVMFVIINTWSSPGKFFGLDLSEIAKGRENHWGHLGEGAHWGAGASLAGGGWEVYYGSCEKSPPSFLPSPFWEWQSSISIMQPCLGMEWWKAVMEQGWFRGLEPSQSGTSREEQWQGGEGIGASLCRTTATTARASLITWATKCINHRGMEKRKSKYSALSDSLCLSLER